MKRLLIFLIGLLAATPARAQFTIPNNDVVSNINQSRIFSTDIAALVQGLKGEGVLSGCAVTAQGSPNMTLAVASGSVRLGGSTVSVSSGNVTITTAHASQPRLDIVVVNNSGTKSVTAGTAAVNPAPAAIPANSVLLATVYVPAADTAINTNQIVDKRVFVLASGSGSVTSIATTSPITGGTITTTGTIACATCATSSATLTANRLILGNGTTDLTLLGSLGSTTTVLHGNAGGAPTFGSVSLTADVSGDLPYANLAQGSALSVLGVTGNATADVASIAAGSDKQVLRRDGTAVAFGAIDLSSSAAVTGILPIANIATGTPNGSQFVRDDGTLATPAGAGNVTTSGSPSSGNLTKFSGATTITNADLTGDVTTSGGVATTLANSGVSAATYTNATVTFDAKGRATSAANGTSPGLVLLEQHTASTSASLDFTTCISGTYDDYLIELVSIVAASNTAQVNLLVSTNGGSSYATSAYSSGILAEQLGGAGAAKVTATNAVLLNNSYGTGVTRGTQSGFVRVFNPGDATLNKLFDVNTIGPSSDGNWYSYKGGAIYDSASAVNALQVKMSTGNITSGTARCYGIAK